MLAGYLICVLGKIYADNIFLEFLGPFCKSGNISRNIGFLYFLRLSWFYQTWFYLLGVFRFREFYRMRLLNVHPDLYAFSSTFGIPDFPYQFLNFQSF